MTTRQLDATRDGRVLAVVDPNAPSAAAAGAVNNATPQFLVVSNWFEDLKARVPVR